MMSACWCTGTPSTCVTVFPTYFSRHRARSAVTAVSTQCALNAMPNASSGFFRRQPVSRDSGANPRRAFVRPASAAATSVPAGTACPSTVTRLRPTRRRKQPRRAAEPSGAATASRRRPLQVSPQGSSEQRTRSHSSTLGMTACSPMRTLPSAWVVLCCVLFLKIVLFFVSREWKHDGIPAVVSETHPFSGAIRRARLPCTSATSTTAPESRVPTSSVVSSSPARATEPQSPTTRPRPGRTRTFCLQLWVLKLV